LALAVNADDVARPLLSVVATQLEALGWKLHPVLANAAEAPFGGAVKVTAAPDPGLLQTEDYARAVIRADKPQDSDESVARAVTARLDRQDLAHPGRPAAAVVHPGRGHHPPHGRRPGRYGRPARQADSPGRAARGGAPGSEGNCVEIAAAADHVLIRDSSRSGGPVLEVPAVVWQQFTRQLAEGSR
jgi:hypothetical protein